MVVLSEESAGKMEIRFLVNCPEVPREEGSVAGDVGTGREGLRAPSSESDAAELVAEGRSRVKSTRQHECGLCGTRFTFKGKLLYHEMQHKDRPELNACDECEMAFHKASSLRNHVKCVHERKRRFQCVQCDKTFFFKKDLPKHVAAVHQRLRPYQCPTCDKAFGKKEHVKRHMLMVHDKQMP